jgi:hypothetical protein
MMTQPSGKTAKPTLIKAPESDAPQAEKPSAEPDAHTSDAPQAEKPSAETETDAMPISDASPLGISIEAAAGAIAQGKAFPSPGTVMSIADAAAHIQYADDSSLWGIQK